MHKGRKNTWEELLSKILVIHPFFEEISKASIAVLGKVAFRSVMPRPAWMQTSGHG
jgi:hypothetical protein